MKQALPVAPSLVLAVVTATPAALAFSAGHATLPEIRRRAEESAAVRTGWPPARVRATVARIDDGIARVRGLRRAEPRPTPTDAVALVREAGR